MTFVIDVVVGVVVRVGEPNAGYVEQGGVGRLGILTPALI